MVEEALPRYRVLGITLESSFPFCTPLPPSSCPPDLRFSMEAKDLAAPPAASVLPAFESPIQIDSGSPLVSLRRTERVDFLHFSEVAEFQVGERLIGCRILDPEYAYMVEIHLLGVVLSYWLERQGIPVLHAAAVSVDGRAVGFMATNKGGKTSLAGSLMERGHSLLSDDLLGIQVSGAEVEARPGFPSIRMWPDLAEHLVGARWSSLPLAHPRFSKRRVQVGEGGFGRFLDQPKPLACLYLPERQEGAGAMGAEPKIRIETVSPAHAVIELVRSSFLPRMAQAAGFAADRLRAFSYLAGRVPVRRLIYPSGFHVLPEVCARILEDLQDLAAATGSGSS